MRRNATKSALKLEQHIRLAILWRAGLHQHGLSWGGTDHFYTGHVLAAQTGKRAVPGGTSRAQTGRTCGCRGGGQSEHSPPRPSQAKNWQACSKMAAYHALRPIDDSTTHVGAYVGNLVHAKLTGHEYTEPQFVVFDEITRNRQEAERQALALLATAKVALYDHELEVDIKEVSMKRTVTVGEADVTVEGTLDLVCRQVRGKSLALLDFKTGRRPPASVFVQIALYAWLWNSRAEWADMAGYLYVHRVRQGRPKPELVLRPVVDLLTVAEDIIRQYALTAIYGTVASPGAHCAYCYAPDCAARDGEFPEDKKVTRV